MRKADQTGGAWECSGPPYAGLNGYIAVKLSARTLPASPPFPLAHTCSIMAGTMLYSAL